MIDKGPMVPRRTEEELKKFILDFIGGQIFLSTQVKRMDDIPMVFLPIALGAFKRWPKKELENVGVIYEYYNVAGPRSANGYPCFFSLRILHREDWEKAAKVIESELDRLGKLQLSPEEPSNEKPKEATVRKKVPSRHPTSGGKTEQRRRRG